MSSPQGNAFSSTISKSDEAITATASWANKFSFDIGNYSDGIVMLKNNGAVNIDYRIYASPVESVTVPVDNDDSWINILDTNADPADYISTTSKTIPAGVSFYESISNKWRWFRVDLKAASGTAAVKIWFRGRNTR